MRKIFHVLLLLSISGFSAISALSQKGLPPGMDEGRRIEEELAKRKKEREQEIIVAPYRGPIRLDKTSRKEIEELQRVDEDEILRHKEVLQGENTGIFKLFPDNGCDEKYMIRADGDCTGFVSESSFYTFRTGLYGTRTFKSDPSGDIGYYKGKFVSRTSFAQSIMVSLGDVPIETVSEAHPAVKLLVDYKPHLTPASAEKAAKVLARGSNTDGYRFAADSGVTVGHTYAFRQIAFNIKGEDPKVEIHTNWRYRSLKAFLKYQERKDTVFIFRVVRQDEHGGITIVWKQLLRKDAPAIVFQKGDKLPVFGEAIAAF